ncbi:MAG: hypothetical protein ACXAC5_07075 [Promethearchaeota archaeon]|jgi:hypothetical protein
MIEDLLIINESGALLYNWHPQGFVSDGKEDLLSGFLTAINSFAVVERGEDIKSLKLKETQIIFEKYNELFQKLTFVITTKNEELIEILHAILHELMDKFPKLFLDSLNKEFNGLITQFRKFDAHMEEIIKSYGLDILDSTLKQVEKGETLKAVIFLEPKGGNIFYIHAKHYINKEQISFLIPLIMNSAKLLYQTNLNENVRWIMLNTVHGENLSVEPRGKILIVKQYQLLGNFEEDLLSLEFFKNKEKYIKKPKRLIEKFEKLVWDPKIKQLSLVDTLGKALYSKVFDEKFDCTDYIPETISFLTSAKKISEDVYNRILFNGTIGGERITTICLNFNNLCLTLIGSIHDFNEFNVIQTICRNIYKQLL